MRRFFVKTNAYNCVAFVDDAGKAYIVHEEVFDSPLTLETAKAADYSNSDDCETAEECAQAILMHEAENNICDFEVVCRDAEEVVEF